MELTIEELKADVKELRRRVAVESQVSDEWMTLAMDWKKRCQRLENEMLKLRGKS